MFEMLISEVEYKFSRSGGPGGQSVNKVSTQVELLFDVNSSAFLSEAEKSTILEKLKNRITNDGILALKCNDTRSQFNNRELVLQRFFMVLEEALKPVKERKPTKKSKASIEKRLKNKKIQSEKKKDRKITDD